MNLAKHFCTKLILCTLLLLGGVYPHGWNHVQAATLGNKQTSQSHATHRSQKIAGHNTAGDSSDALALSEEEVDRLKIEQKDLLRRRKALEVMLAESRRLFKLKEQRIQALQELLSQERAPTKANNAR